MLKTGRDYILSLHVHARSGGPNKTFFHATHHTRVVYCDRDIGTAEIEVNLKKIVDVSI